MRFLHTADWHLGQDFHDIPREAEHQAFLDWLADQLVAQGADALLVTGDIYDSQNPPIGAQRQLYRFIAEVRRRKPNLDIVLIGGNHDSAGRLEAPGPLLDPFGVRVIGSLPRTAGGGLDFDRLTVPLHDSDGTVAALVAAVPFLRLPDLPPAPDDCDDPLIWGVGQIYREALAGVAARLEPGQALIATGHCYMTGSELSDLSERRILGGNQHALPVDLFPADLAYVALGHLHKAQCVGGRAEVRYSGSPLPLSVVEREYRHQVVMVDLKDGMAQVTPLIVPRTVEIVRVPTRGAALIEDALAALRALSADPARPRELWPYLDIVIAADGPLPSLRRDVDEAIAGKGLRLARLKVETEAAAADSAAPPPDLETMVPEEVFVRCWQRTYRDAPPEATLDAFRELLEHLESGESA
ncbi:exonuclease SbcCD subunit D [Magnetospirillum fulvum]|uniref:Nuclease SbcCD subunit D n=1 Tax=Magnetospirillum fulvum TaxID=1082 RepID=A0A1H6HDA4_MAGFU|nr:exonuclease SbcCD subunit D C-terminal domain-containing protein [Magnetospirillum fulvum]SEH32175.1 Exodeoxyribonuclease I subunit D [Magnetospirillum fulvum]